jgi:hypothetical protein
MNTTDFYNYVLLPNNITNSMIDRIDMRWQNTGTGNPLSVSDFTRFVIGTITYYQNGSYTLENNNISSTGITGISGDGYIDFSVYFRNISLPILPSQKRYVLYYQLFNIHAWRVTSMLSGKSSVCPSTYPNDDSLLDKNQTSCGNGTYSYFQPYMIIYGYNYIIQPNNTCYNETTLKRLDYDGTINYINCNYGCNSGECNQQNIGQLYFNSYVSNPYDSAGINPKWDNSSIILNKNWENWNLSSIGLKLYNLQTGNPLSCSPLYYNLSVVAFDNPTNNLTLIQTLYVGSMNFSGDGDNIALNLNFNNTPMQYLPLNQRYEIILSGCGSFRILRGFKGSSSSCSGYQSQLTYGQDSSIEPYRTYYRLNDYESGRYLGKIICGDGFQYWEEPYINMSGQVLDSNLKSNPYIINTTNLTINTTNSTCGLFSPSVAVHVYPVGSNITVTVYPYCTFNYWQLNNGTVINSSSFGLTMNTNYIATAYFVGGYSQSNETGGGVNLPPQYAYINPFISGYFILGLFNLGLCGIATYYSKDFIMGLGVFLLFFLVFLVGGLYPNILWSVIIFIVALIITSIISSIRK